MLYENAEQAKLRLGNCIFLYGNDWVKCLDARDRGNGRVDLFLQKRVNEDHFAVQQNDAAIEFMNMRHGYFNVGTKGAFYMVRSAARIARQGLCGDNTTIYKLDQPILGNCRASGPKELIGEGGWRWSSQDTAQVHKCLYRNDYPTLEQAMQKMADNPLLKSVALSRTIAIIRNEDINLHYVHVRGHTAGVFHPRSGLMLGEQKMYLLEEVKPIFKKVA